MPSSGKRGFGSMGETKQRQIASKGGQAAHAKGSAHEFSTEEAREAGSKGGKAAHTRKAPPMSSPPRRRVPPVARAARLRARTATGWRPSAAKAANIE